MNIITLAQESGSGNSNPLDLFLQYGVLGLVIIAFLTGWIATKPEVDRLIRDKERLQAQKDTLIQTYEEKIIPALIASSQMTATLRPILEDVVNVLNKMQNEIPPKRGSVSGK